MLNKAALFLFSIFFVTTNLLAQEKDSLFVTQNGKNWMSVYVVKKAETLFLLARRFHVPPAVLADANGLNYQSSLNVNSTVVIPMGNYNLFKKIPGVNASFRPIYHRIVGNDNLYRISECSGTNEATLLQWNGLKNNKVKQGQVLLVGWIQYDDSQIITPPAKENAKPAKGVQVINVPLPQDTVTHRVTDFEKVYLKQTNNEANIVTEKGPVAFFENTGSKVGNVFYAFHNNTPRGTIVKIYNPGNGKTVYAKVLGPIPDTKLYYNCILGISSNARVALGTNDAKIWCELYYSNR